MPKKSGATKGHPPKSHNATKPRPSASSSQKTKKLSEQGNTSSGKAGHSQQPRRLNSGGTSWRVVRLIAVLCLVGLMGFHQSDFYQLEGHNWPKSFHQLLSDCQAELLRLACTDSLLQLLKSAWSSEVVPIGQTALLIFIACAAVQIVRSLLASKRKRSKSRRLAPNPERKIPVVDITESTKEFIERQLPELVKKLESLHISEESRKNTKSLVPKLPIIQKQVEKESAKNKPSKQESKQKTTIAADNGRLKNNRRQKQIVNMEEMKTCTIRQDSLIRKPHSEDTQQIEAEEEVRNQKRQIKQIDAKLKVNEQPSASLQDKETVDDNEHTQRDMNEEIADGDATKETGGNCKTSKKNKRQQNGRKKVDEGRTNEKPRDHIKEIEGNPIRSPTGLINIGNTCFFNAIMQNLNQSSVLGELLSEQKLDFPLTKSMVEFYDQMGRKGNKSLEPNRLFQSLCNRSPRFKGGHQQDSHELLRNLLDGLRNEEREQASPELDKRKVLTTVDRTFGGHFLTVYKCKDCSKPYHVCEPFLDISLPIQLQDLSDEKTTHGELNVHDVAISLMTPLNEHRQESQDTRKSSSNTEGSESNPTAGSKRRWNKDSAAIGSRPRKRSRTEGLSILDCLNAFTRTEFITKEYLCMICHEKRVSQGETDYKMSSAIKRTLVINPPALLTLHLKRFTQTSRGFVKCNDTIAFPDRLDLSPYCSFLCMRNDGNEKNIWYSLYGVVVHGGELSGGHYSAYVKLRTTPDVNIRNFLQQSFLDRDELTEERLVEMMTEMKNSLKQNPRVEWIPQKEAVQGNWFYISDSLCTPVPRKDVFQRPAYLLFYERMTRLNDVGLL